ncbi:hypothetical protein BS47DRAFT_1346165 [Hydnum rufescens UP504]|uniref:CBS domain-containing protein n=1 Tax=Hydnum rufescens UP504 TaxID=1448309 RepID=A0A9P6AU54_9AGAM|nr:hypothetical protein BS47DRAFT_1346165 [Hydnum rufescens UP504]
MATTLASISTVPSAGSGSPSDKYRGAVVEDLQLPPAFSLQQDQRLDKAIELAYDRDFSHIPILSRERRPLGYLDVAQLKSKWEAGAVNADDSVLTHTTKFKRNPKNGYTLITPLTPLEVLEQFLDSHLFALVTDQSRKFVLAVATRQDLDNFVTRRGRGFY